MSELDYLKGRYLRGAMSRRELIGRAAALGTVATTLGGLLVPGAALAAEEPVKGGTLRLGLAGGSTTDSIDITSYNDSVMIATSHALFNSLVEWSQEGRAVPELAESFEPKNGAVDWIFNLRKGIKFSNGKEFDADDAIYSLNLHRGEGSKSGGKGALASVKDIKKLSASQIQITLDAADADFPYNLTDYHMHMVPDGFKDWANPVGTGAFTLEKFDPGVRVVLKGTGNYWKKGRGHLDRVEITVINDGNARLAALTSGQVDAINRVDGKTVEPITKMGKFDITRAAGGYHVVMAMTVDQAPFNNPDLRLAMKYAMDREQIMKTLFNGYGKLGNDHPVPESDPYFNSQLPQNKFDLDKAKFHFKKAGLTDPKILLQTSEAAFNGAVNMGALLQASTSKAGIKMDVKAEPADGFWSNVWLKGPFVGSYWGGRAAATQMLGVCYKAGANWNETHWNDAKFEKLLGDARAETDEAKRKKYIWDCQEILSTQGGALIPAFKDWVSANTKKVGGITPHSGFDMDNGLVCEKAWMKA